MADIEVTQTLKTKTFPWITNIAAGTVLTTLVGVGTVAIDTLADSMVPPPSGLVSWWPGAGNALDCVGTSNGTLAGEVDFALGKVGQAFNFTGGTGYIHLPQDLFPFPSSGTDNTPFTLELWVKTALGGVLLGRPVYRFLASTLLRDVCRGVGRPSQVPSRTQDHNDVHARAGVHRD
ncbi:MAG: hypothetical protein WCS01_07185 [bacterium]